MVRQEICQVCRPPSPVLILTTFRPKRDAYTAAIERPLRGRQNSLAANAFIDEKVAEAGMAPEVAVLKVST